jgi:hypothetical protein
LVIFFLLFFVRLFGLRVFAQQKSHPFGWLSNLKNHVARALLPMLLLQLGFKLTILAIGFPGKPAFGFLGWNSGDFGDRPDTRIFSGILSRQAGRKPTDHDGVCRPFPVSR